MRLLVLYLLYGIHLDGLMLHRKWDLLSQTYRLL
nr:MAG TPA: hypothetical protein [Crassvirales sp.]